MPELATYFENFTMLKQDIPLTNEQIFCVAPSVFAQSKHESRSNRYTYIPTIEILMGLRSEGFQPFMVVQSKSRIKGKEDFTKHMLRLRHESQINRTEANEIILINSHDGTSSYQMLAGTFRFVCQNGLVTGDTIEDIKVPHRGNIKENVIEAAYQIVDEFNKVTSSIDLMKSTRLELPEAEVFAESALALKYDTIESSPITPAQLLSPRRVEDMKELHLWGVMNRVQENLIRGGQKGILPSGKKITTRSIKSIDNNIRLNRALWMLTDKMTKLKNL